MFLLIIVSTVVLLFSIIVAAAIYLLYLIIEGTDDDNEPDTLVLDTHDLSISPVVSPLNTEINNSHEIGCPYHHHYHLQYEIEKLPIEQPAHFEETKAKPSQEIGLSRLIRPQSVSSKETVIKSRKTPTIQQSKKSTPIRRSPTSFQASKLAQKSTAGNGQKVAQLGSIGKNLFDDYDLKEMQLGGNSLHWCKTRKALDRLMKLELPINAVNKHQETPLHVATRKRNLQMVTGLLCHGAKVNCKNDKGETPLIVACKNNDTFACQILLVFDSEVNCKDRMGLSARHYAANICGRHKEQTPNAAHVILAMLDELGAKRCLEIPATNTANKKPEVEPVASKSSSSLNSKSKSSTLGVCADGCLHSGSYNGNSYDRWVDYGKESLYKRYLFTDIIDNLLESLRRDKQNNRDLKRSRLLCIDGGGMRGVIVCQVMIELEKYLKKPMINYFDWIGGTSVGAFLACALSLGMSIFDLRRICFDVKDEVFNGNRPYNPKFLERVLKRTYGATTRMSEVKGRKLVVTTVLADRDPCQLKFFRNYPSGTELLEQHKISVEYFDYMSDHSTVSKAPPCLSISNKSSISLKSSAKSLKTDSPSRPSSPNLIPSVSSKAVKTLENFATLKEESSTGKTIAKRVETNGRDESSVIAISVNERDPYVWQAVRASSAAPFFFKPYGPFLDGGIISNNPTIDMLTEFFHHQKVKKFLRQRIDKKDLKDACLEETPEEMSLVVSLGTGRGRVIGHQKELDFGSVASGLATVFSPVELLRSIRAARTLFRKLMHRSCMTDDYIVDRAQGWCASLDIPYFRINPPLASVFSIDDKRDEQLINALWQTKLYMRAMSSQVKQLSELLDSFSPST